VCVWGGVEQEGQALCRCRAPEDRSTDMHTHTSSSTGIGVTIECHLCIFGNSPMRVSQRGAILNSSPMEKKNTFLKEWA
jgi:hypothetical protein